MARMVPLPVKVDPNMLIALQNAAAKRDLSLSEYVRDVLSQQSDQEDRFDALIRLIEQSDFDKSKSILIEMLLLIRMAAGADKVKVIDAEMRRINIEKWSAKNEK